LADGDLNLRCSANGHALLAVNVVIATISTIRLLSKIRATANQIILERLSILFLHKTLCTCLELYFNAWIAVLTGDMKRCFCCE